MMKETVIGGETTRTGAMMKEIKGKVKNLDMMIKIRAKGGKIGVMMNEIKGRVKILALKKEREEELKMKIGLKIKAGGIMVMTKTLGRKEET